MVADSAELTVAAVVFVLLTDTCRTFGTMVLVYLLDFTGRDWVYQISNKISKMTTNYMD